MIDRWVDGFSAREQAEAMRTRAEFFAEVSEGPAGALARDMLSLVAAVSRLESERDELAAEVAGRSGAAGDPEMYLLAVDEGQKALDRAHAAEARLDVLTRALALAAIPIEALAAVHADGKWIAPSTVESLNVARDAIREALAGDGHTPPETVGVPPAV